MKIKLSRSQWEKIGQSTGWMGSDEGKLTTMRDELAEEEQKQQNTFNGKPILNPENAIGENLYEVAFGGVVNAGLIGFDGLVYAFDEQEAVDRVLDKYPHLGISQKDLVNYEEENLSHGGNASIPYDPEDLRILRLVKRAT